jgi:hypothetical protein
MRLLALLAGSAALFAAEPLPFTVKLETLAVSTAPGWQWFHPRPAAIPGRGLSGAPLAVITLQRHLEVSDYYSDLGRPGRNSRAWLDQGERKRRRRGGRCHARMALAQPPPHRRRRSRAIQQEG